MTAPEQAARTALARAGGRCGHLGPGTTRCPGPAEVVIPLTDRHAVARCGPHAVELGPRLGIPVPGGRGRRTRGAADDSGRCAPRHATAPRQAARAELAGAPVSRRGGASRHVGAAWMPEVLRRFDVSAWADPDIADPVAALRTARADWRAARSRWLDEQHGERADDRTIT